MIILSDKSKLDVQMDVFASDPATLMMSIHRLKESVRWNEFILSPKSRHFKATYMSFTTANKNLSVDLGSTDERLYDTSDIMNRSNYRLEVSLRIMNHDSISSIKTAQVNLSSLVNFKIQAVHKRAQSVEIPRNADYWWTLESELCSTKMIRQRTVIAFKEGYVYRTMRSQMPAEPGIVFVYHRGTLHTNNDAHDLPLHKQLFYVGAMSVVQSDEDLIELVRFVIPTSRTGSLIGKEDRIRAALVSSIEDLNVGVKLEWWKLEMEVCSTESVRQQNSFLVKNGYVKYRIPLDVMFTSGVTFAYYRAIFYKKTMKFFTNEDLQMEKRELVLGRYKTTLSDWKSFGHVKFSVSTGKRLRSAEKGKIRNSLQLILEKRQPSILACGLELVGGRVF
ncbi:hypothetical protein FBUS_03265 [Fasciolopsis buskii]|uniref:Uncharacterized protein n=1 Tax=Fasciolopsis buskii TaxID=27845 RepID=A0A8E0RQS8_9TREM|nr:hypothetical protein FBUS_03265 [Fasciolopsis buski]